MSTWKTSPLILAGALMAVGCSDSTSPDAADIGDLNMDVAVMAQEATLDDIRNMSLGFWGIDGPMGVGAVTDFRDGAGITDRDSFTRSRTVTYYDAEGAEMDRYVAGETESIRIQIEMDGSVDRDHWQATIHRERDKTVSGLSDDDNLREWNGEGSAEVSHSRYNDEGGERSRDMESESLYEGIVVAVPRSENPYPLSGTITRHVRIEIVNGPNGDETREKTVVITFDGDHTATMTVDGEEFEIDLSERQGRPPKRTDRAG